MKRKGFTLIELLVVIAIIAMLMSILMPALARVREIANRVVCGTNLSGIGKAMAIYSNDDENGRFPQAGGPHAHWGTTTAWDAVAEVDAFGTPPNNYASIQASFYLLVKGDYTTTKQYVCKSDSQNLGAFTPSAPYDIWDFGDTPIDHCSYAYHMPYDDAGGFNYCLTAASNPGLAAAADRNPDDDSDSSHAHQDEGQNVLYVDGHVTFEKNEGGKRSRDCGLNDDDIYTGGGTQAPLDKFDSYLVSNIPANSN